MAGRVRVRRLLYSLLCRACRLVKVHVLVGEYSFKNILRLFFFLRSLLLLREIVLWRLRFLGLFRVKGRRGRGRVMFLRLDRRLYT